MMSQEHPWPQVSGLSSCVSVSHSQSLQTPLHSLCSGQGYSHLSTLDGFTPSPEADRLVSASVSLLQHHARVMVAESSRIVVNQGCALVLEPDPRKIGRRVWG